MFSVEKYADSVKKHLENHSDMLVRNLKKIFKYNFSSEVDLLEFTVYVDDNTFEFSIMMFLMDLNGDEVVYKGKDKTIFVSSTEILPEVKYCDIDESLLDDFYEFYDQNEDRFYTQEQLIFTKWFSQCWEKADGDTVKLPSYFAFPNDDRSYDLKNHQWVHDEKKWF
ncbi:hypothetical protein LC087_16550 [Bacillus carboniphilus]|uniref:Uncharacterized protein n=1 Tax=Bacillus carboniphilus TaxID=86663 RepID=A0ABY9JSC6_9BACI|nr:hypothetical protein [Bacillus carboniphilus]WLR42307.1 hypothetical protein LC087_16550 [Bacillus carboniphilus]